MAEAGISKWGLTLGAPLLVALLLLLMRVFVMGKAQEKRQRANRQQTERLKSMVAAYRALAGSFRPVIEGEHIQAGDHSALEAALSDIILFGSPRQVEMAAECARALVSGKVPPLWPLVNDLRTDLRAQLGLAPLDAALQLPEPGPYRGGRVDRNGGAKDGGDGVGVGARGSGGGGMGGGMLLGGAGAGIHSAGGNESYLEEDEPDGRRPDSH